MHAKTKRDNGETKTKKPLRSTESVKAIRPNQILTFTNDFDE